MKRVLKSKELGRRKNYADLNDALSFMADDIASSGCLHGYRWMHQKLQNAGLRVRKEDVRLLLAHLDPAASAERQSRKLSRRRYYANRPNYIWHIDSYDKLKPFGICINGCIDGFSRKIMWLNAYNTSSDPKVIAGYFLERMKKIGASPMIVRADKGTENVVVGQIQRQCRRNGQDPFHGDKSFMTGRSVHNQRVEYWWSFLRRECTDFWLNLFHDLKEHGEYDGSFIDRNLSLFCFLGSIQVALINRYNYLCKTCTLITCFLLAHRTIWTRL